MVKSIQCYNNSDVYKGQDNVQSYGFDKNKTLGEMIDEALKNNCIIITKNGKGKWYLKGLDKDYSVSKRRLEENIGKYPRRQCWLIEI